MKKYSAAASRSTDFVPSEETDSKSGIERVIAQESNYINRQRPGRIVRKKKIGLALSGGGIRSATFSLGVIQQLAQAKWLESIDYLSTVSGGGYIGSSLTWLLHKDWGMGKDRFGVSANNFPYGTNNVSLAADLELRVQQNGGADANNASQNKIELLRTLRQNGNYLIPGNGLNIFSLVAVMLRGTILSLFVYVPLLTLVMLALYASYLVRPVSDYSRWWFDLTSFSILDAESALNASLFAVLIIAAGSLVSSLCFAISTYTQSAAKRRDRYMGRRRYEIVTARLLVTGILLIIIGILPVFHRLISEYFTAGNDEIVAMACGLLSTLLGFVASMAAFFKSGGSGAKTANSKSPLALLVWPAAFFLLFGVLFLAYIAAEWLFEEGNRFIWIAFSIWVMAAMLVGRFVNLNYISIHRYYRDRLMETFLPDVGSLTGDKVSDDKDYNPADYTPLSEMCRETSQAIGPYHLINTNIVLVESENKKFRARGGDSFVLSPLYCGSSATGWLTTNKFMNNNMTLATAMAISGAAANPDTGVGGEGPTRNPVLSILMSLLNVRLGYWAPNPNPQINRWQGHSQAQGIANPLHGYRPNFIVPTLTSTALGKIIGAKISRLFRSTISPQNFGKNEQNRLIELTDGGHFENLGLYELIRRKLDTIIVCDGAADPDFQFADLGNAVEKARVDFGAIITIDVAPLIPSNKDFMSRTIPCAESGFVVGKIAYSDRTGTLIYIKTTLVPGLPADLISYRKTHRSFPDQTTADQFFDEKQFEAYRELGNLIGKQTTDNCTLTQDGEVKPDRKAVVV